MKTEQTEPNPPLADNSLIISEFQYYAYDFDIEKFTIEEKTAVIVYCHQLSNMLHKYQIRHSLCSYRRFSDTPGSMLP